MVNCRASLLIFVITKIVNNVEHGFSRAWKISILSCYFTVRYWQMPDKNVHNLHMSTFCYNSSLVQTISVIVVLEKVLIILNTYIQQLSLKRNVGQCVS